MKLGELKGEKAIEVIADLIEPLVNISMDKESLQLFSIKAKKGEENYDAAVRDFTEKIPLLLKTHKADILKILSVIGEKPTEEMSMVDIFSGVADLVQDEDFMSLFLSLAKPTAGK